MKNPLARKQGIDDILFKYVLKSKNPLERIQVNVFISLYTDPLERIRAKDYISIKTKIKIKWQ
jgi:hypothetical protein